MSGDRSEPLRPRDPRRLGDYELIGRLGEGGMGTVYLARDKAGVQVAVKVIRADLAPDDEFRRRFRSEVARARQVPPFCTAEVLDADPDHEQPYLVVEYVDGPTLADVVEERGPLTASNLHSVAIGVATALTAIHGAGVIHRDLKPRNVLLAPGSPKVIDFGIARATEATSGNTSPDQMVGTVAYMAPERFGLEADSPLTPAADVFAWGGVVAYAGTGRTPFAADSPPATAARILTQPPDLTGLSGPLRELVARALHKDPADRPSARELLDLLLDGPQRPAATAEALADQPDLRAAAAEAQAVTGLAVLPSGLVGYDEESIITVPISAIPAPAPLSGPPAPEPHRRWFLPVAVAFLVLAVVAGAMMLVLGPPDRGDGTDPTAAVIEPSVAESAPASAAADPPLISDSLREPRAWLPRSSDKSRCFFDNGLIAHRDNSDPLRCPGPTDRMPADFRAEVTVRLITQQSCAGLWFRFDEKRGGYLVRVCENRIYFGTHKPRGGSTPLRTFYLDSPVALGATARITLIASGTSLSILRAGAPVGTAGLTDPTITTGRVLLGEYADPEAEPSGTYEVAFNDVAIWEATS
jgi:eukaryotic-like serine/threonine-protein kinase